MSNTFEKIGYEWLYQEAHNLKEKLAYEYIWDGVPAMIDTLMNIYKQQVMIGSECLLHRMIINAFDDAILDSHVFSQVAVDFLKANLFPNPNGVDLFSRDIAKMLPEIGFFELSRQLESCYSLIDFNLIETAKKADDGSNMLVDLLTDLEPDWRNRVARYALVGQCLI